MSIFSSTESAPLISWAWSDKAFADPSDSSNIKVMKQKTISPLEDFLSQIMITEMTLYPFLLRLLYNEIYSVVNKGLSQKRGL